MTSRESNVSEDLSDYSPQKRLTGERKSVVAQASSRQKMQVPPQLDDLEGKTYSQKCQETYDYLDQLTKEFDKDEYPMDHLHDEIFDHPTLSQGNFVGKGDRVLFMNLFGQVYKKENWEQGQAKAAEMAYPEHDQALKYFKYDCKNNRVFLRYDDCLQMIPNFMNEPQNNSYDSIEYLDKQISYESSAHVQIGNEDAIFVAKDDLAIAKIKVLADQFDHYVESYTPEIEIQAGWKLKYYLTINEVDMILAYYVQELNDQALFKFIQQTSYSQMSFAQQEAPQEKPISVPKDLTIMSLNEEEDFVFCGQSQGQILVWFFHENNFTFFDELPHVHQTQVTCLKSINESVLGSGANHENFIALWDYKKKEQIGRINCQGCILDMILLEDRDLAIFSSTGLFRVDDVVHQEYVLYDHQQKITCKDVCFLRDGDTYFIGCGKHLVQKSLAKQSQSQLQKDIRQSKSAEFDRQISSQESKRDKELSLELEGEILDIRVDEGTDQTKLYVNVISKDDRPPQRQSSIRLNIGKIQGTDRKRSTFQKSSQLNSSSKLKSIQIEQLKDNTQTKSRPSTQIATPIIQKGSPNEQIMYTSKQKDKLLKSSLDTKIQKEIHIQKTIDNSNQQEHLFLNRKRSSTQKQRPFQQVVETADKIERPMDQTIDQSLINKSKIQKRDDTLEINQENERYQNKYSIQNQTLNIDHQQSTLDQPIHQNQIGTLSPDGRRESQNNMINQFYQQKQINQLNNSEHDEYYEGGVVASGKMDNKRLKTYYIEKEQQMFSTKIVEVALYGPNHPQHGNKLGQIRQQYPCPNDDSKYHKHKRMHIIKQESTYLATSGTYGVKLFNINDYLEHTDKGIDIKRNQTIEQCEDVRKTNKGINYIPYLFSGAIVTSTNEGKIEFFYDKIPQILQNNVKKRINANIDELKTNFQKDGFTSVITVSDEKVDDDFKFIATGDNIGNILIWTIDSNLNNNCPRIHLKYEGQVFDLQFIQKSTINSMISLHSNPDKIIITSLYDFKVTRMVDLPFHTRSFALVDSIITGYQVFLVSAFDPGFQKNGKRDTRGQMIKIDLSFKKHKGVLDGEKNLSMRDQNLLTLFNSKDEQIVTKLLDIWCTKSRRGIIDCLNSINLLNFCSRQPHFHGLQKMCEYQYLDNLMDSQQQHASYYLQTYNNESGLHVMFHNYLKNQIDIDEYILRHGLLYNVDWMFDDSNNQFFHQAQTWNLETPIFGIFRLSYRFSSFSGFWHKKEVLKLTDSPLISEELIQSFTELNKESKNSKMTCRQKLKRQFQKFKFNDEMRQIDIQISKVPIYMVPGSEQSLDFLSNVQNFQTPIFDTDLRMLIEYKWRENKFVFVPLLLQAFYLYFLLNNAILHSNMDISKPYILLLTLFLISNEMVQMIIFGLKEYFSDLDDYFDLIGLTFIIIYCIYAPENEHDHQKEKEYLTIGLFFLMSNMILQIANLTKTLRTTWIIIEKSVLHAMQYMVIPLMFVINFTFCKAVIGDEAFNFRHRFWTLFGDEYQQMFGENVEEFSRRQYAMIFLYVMGTFLINIICLNILISVVTDNYDLVIQRIEAEDCKIKAKKLLTQETFMSIMQKCSCLKQEKKSKKYLMIARYYECQVSADEEQGKFKQLQYRIHQAQRIITRQVQFMINVQRKQMDIKQKQLEQKLDKVLEIVSELPTKNQSDMLTQNYRRTTVISKMNQSKASDMRKSKQEVLSSKNYSSFKQNHLS